MSLRMHDLLCMSVAPMANITVSTRYTAERVLLVCVQGCHEEPISWKIDEASVPGMTGEEREEPTAGPEYDIVAYRPLVETGKLDVGDDGVTERAVKKGTGGEVLLSHDER
ncbi:hypothetical protein NM688_g2154 [Phlebia brevispora]|uniref:Uncharacterized protein n=1 Tax=Phlebia brevispora TaxID=194682 RepID=A0ACC1T9M7_9APHY|nr:hypothetical protein NM688_g2154 [Phlebia brevispora]